MRVSSHQLLDAAIRSIQQHSVEAMKWQQQISSGNKYLKASEGAVAIARGVEIQFDKSKYAMLKANQDFVATRMALADAQLGGMHDALSEMQQIGVQARDAAIGKIGLQSLAQRARAAYDLLAQQAVAMDTNDERYLLDTTNVARLDQPKITARGSDSVAQQDSITLSGNYLANEIIELTVNGVKLQYVVAEGGEAASVIAPKIVTQFSAPPDNVASAAVTATASGSGVITLEAKKPGVSFTATVTENSSTGTALRAEVRANVTEVSTATIAPDAVFHKAGTYLIDKFSTRSIGAGETITEARLQIEGKGPDGSASSYYVGVYKDGILKFPQQPDNFMNLEIGIVGNPDHLTELRFEANPVTVRLNPTAKLHADGAYSVELSKGDQFVNGNFERAGVTYEGTSAFIDGWTATLSASAGANTTVISGTNTIDFSTQTRFDSGRSLLLKSAGVSATATAGAASVAGPELLSETPIQLYASNPENGRIADTVNFRWATTSTELAKVTVSLVNIDTNESTVLLSSTAAAPTATPSWAELTHTVIKDGRYRLKVETATVDSTIDGISNATTSVYIDDVQVVSGAKELTAATLTFDGAAVKTVTVANGGLSYDAATKTTRISFIDSADDPSNFYDLSLDLVGDPANLRTTNTINFRVDPKVKQIEIEPGIWVPEGISFREALGNTAPRSRDVLADARAFVESLERAAVSGSLESDFTGKMANLDSATDQVLKYQIRAGVIGAQVDAAKAALEIKATELEAHRSRLLDTDIAEASAGLVRTQTLLEAARSIFARLESSNLFQRLM
jgi:flagellin-like hook-associated protein FlgL